ncbi:trichohyalin isoform X3 [Brienomyrus brachyistius]|uniref:trichohyalin isoform X3 n=1 Tax=Brienomyrus brachyistius TaxID=42636 RepID=UPI0020B1A19F|nr:trichohyalin isoform X3 [Brienomyrus brachyistius]
MDSQSTFLSRIGQVFWEILGYVTSAVQRYLTPAPPNTGNDDTHISPEARVCEERNSDKEEEDNYLREETKRDSKCWSHVDTADERVVNLMQREILLSNQQEANDGQDKADITQDKMKLAVEVEDTYIFANEQENKKQDDKTTEDESHKSVDQRTEKKIESVEEAAFRLPGDEYPFREEDESKWERKKERKNARKYEDLIQSNEVNIFRGHTEERDVTEKVKGESGVKEVVMIREDMMGRSNGKTEAVAGETPFGVDEFLLSDTIDTLEIEPADGVEAGSTGQGSNEENERCTEESMGIVSITKTSMGVLERGSKGEEMRGKWQGVQKSQRLEKKTNSHKKELAGADERDMSYLYELGEEDRKEDESTVGKNGEECARIQPVQKEKVDNRKKEEKSYEEKQEAKIEGECGSGIYEIFETASKEVDVSMENRESDKVGQEEEKREVEQNETAEMGVQERLQVMETEIILETVMAGEGRDESRKTQMAGQDEVQRVEEYADVNKNVTQRNEESKDGEISPESVLTLNMGQYKRTKERVEEEGDVNKLRDELDEEDKSQGSITEDRDESNVTEESGGNGGRERCVFELEKEGNNIYEGMRDIKILHEERWREKSKINEEVAASWVDVGESVAANEKLAKENKVTSGTEWKDEGEVDKEKEREREERSPKEEPTGVEVSMEDGELDKVEEEEENRGAELKEWVETEVQEREKEKVEEEGDVDKLRDEFDEEDKSQVSVTEERDESDVIEEGGEDGERERCLSESEKEGNDASVGMRDIEILQKERWRKESKINEEVAASWVDVGESVAANEKLAKENKVTSGTEWKDEGEVDKEKEREREERSHKEEPTGVEASMEDGELDKVEEEEENRGAELNERVETEVQEREKEKVEEEGDVDKLRDELDEEDISQGSVTEERDESDVIEGGGEYGERERCLSESEKEKNDASVGMRDIEILLEKRWREESKINEEVAASWVDVGESVAANEKLAKENKVTSGTEWKDEGEVDKEREREERSHKEEPTGVEASMEDGELDKVEEEEENRGAELNERVETEVQEREKEKVEEEGDVDKLRDEFDEEDKSQGSVTEERDESDVIEEGGEDGERQRCLSESEKEGNDASVVMRDIEILHEERWREESKINEEVAASWVDVGESVAANEKLAKENKVTSGTEWKDEGEVDKEREREERSHKEEPTGVEASMEDGELDKVEEEEENRGAELNERVETEVQEREKEKVEEEGDVDKLRDEFDEEDKSQGSVTEERDESDVIEEGGEDGERQRCLSESEKEGNDASVGMRDIEILHEERWREESKINEEVAASWVDVGESVAANEKLAKENKVTSGTEWKDEGEVDKEKEREREERSPKEEPTGVEASMEDGELDKVEEEEENRGAELNERVETEVQEREKEKVEEEGDVDKLRDEFDEEDKSQGSVTEERDESDVIEEGGEDGERQRCLSESEKEGNDASVGMRDIEILQKERWREESKINEEVAASWVDVGESVAANEKLAKENRVTSGTEWKDEGEVDKEKEREREERSPKEEPTGVEVSMEDGELDKVKEEEENRGAELKEWVETEVQKREKEKVEEEGDVDKLRDELDEEDISQGSVTEERDESDVIEEGGEDGERQRCLSESEKEGNDASVGMRDIEILHEERWREESKINEEVAASWVDVGESVAANEKLAKENKVTSGTEWKDEGEVDKEKEREREERSHKEEPTGVEVSMEDGELDKVEEEEENRGAELNERVETEVQEREKEKVEEEGDVDKLRDEFDEEDKSQGSVTEERDESDVIEEGGEDGERQRCLSESEKEGNDASVVMRDIEILHEERWREESKINEEVAASWVDVGESVAANEKLAKENKVTSGTEWKDEGEVDKEREREERSHKEEPTGVEASMEDGELDKVEEEEENRGAELNERVETEVQEREKEKVEEEGDVDKLRDEFDEEDKSQGSVTEERDESDVIEEGGEDGERQRCLSESEKEGNDASVVMRDIEILHEERWREESKINEEVAASWVDVGESVAANEKLAKENKVTSGTEWKDEGEVDKEKEREREERSHKEEPTGVEASMEDGELDKVEEEEENRGAELNERVETEVQEREKEKVEEEGDVDKLRDELDEEDKSQGSVTEERDKSDVIEGGGEYGERERCLSESEKEKNDASVGMRDIEILLEERWREESKINEEVAASWVDVGESMEAKKIVAEITKEISRTEWMDDINYEGEEYKERRREERSSIEESAGAEVSMKDGKSDQLREEKDNRGAKKNEVVEVEVQEKLLLKEPEIKHETIMAGGEEEMRKTQVAGQDEVQREEESAEMEKNATQRYEKSNDQVTLPEGVFTLNMGQFETEKDSIEEEGDMNKLRDELDEEKNQGSVTENIEESGVIEDGGEDGERERCLSLHEERWREESKINEEVAASWVDVGESKACEVNVQNIREEKNLEISVTELRDDRKHRENVYKVKEQEILHISTEEQPYENINIFHEALDMSKTNETKTDLQQTEEPRTHENIFGRNSQVIDLFKVAEQKETKKEERDNECLEKQRTILKVGETKDEGHLSDENVDIKTMEEGDGMDLNVAPACKSELIEGFSANVETVGITLRDGWAIEETEETRNNDGNQNGDTLYAVDRGLIRGAERRRNINECTRSTTEGQRPKIQLKIEKGVKLEEDENFTNVKEIQSQFGDAKLHKTSEHGKLFAEITGQCRTRIVNKETDGNEGRKQITKDGVGKKRIQKRTHENEEVFNLQLDSPSLDFTAQKFRIALKNRHTRAPKDPRILLHISSLSPTSAPPKLDEETATKPVGIKVGGAGMMGFKLPGIGAGFPVLKKTEGRVEEKGEEGSGQMIMKAPTPNLGPDDREPAATKKWAAGSVGVMLPGLGPGMPALRKTDKGVKLIEKTTDDATVSHGKRDTSSGGGAERNREESKEKGVKGFGAGFPVLRKTGMGNKLRGEEGKTSEAEQNETENNQPEKPGSDSPMLVSELKKRFMKTERK